MIVGITRGDVDCFLWEISWSMWREREREEILKPTRAGKVGAGLVWEIGKAQRVRNKKDL